MLGGLREANEARKRARAGVPPADPPALPLFAGKRATRVEPGGLGLLTNMDQSSRDLLASLAYLLIGAALVALFIHVGDTYMNGFALQLGSLGPPTPDYVLFTAFWMLLGGPAAFRLALGFARLVEAPRLAGVFSALKPPRDSVWIFAVATLAVVIPLGLRELLLGTAPMTDDEGAYEFMARLLASGRLYAQSPPLKEHFDIHFMVNDGKYYSHYFLGWPALMVPGIWLGIPKHLGALYSGALVAGLFLVVRRVAGPAWARLATVVCLTSVLFMVGAATQLSHVPCAALLVWFSLAVLRSRDADRPPWIHAAVAVLYVVAFWVRPMTAFGIGVPFLVHWFVGTLRLSRRQRWLGWLSFSIVAAVGAAGFLAVNWVQNGSPFSVAYQTYLAYTRQNGYAFSPFSAAYDTSVSAFEFDVGPMLAGFAGTLYRVNSGAFGWPSCLLPAFLAWSAPRTRLWWWCLGWYTLTHLPVEGAGVDTFGPIKTTEIIVVLLILAMAGLSHAQESLGRLEGLPSWLNPRLPMALGVALVFVNLIGYVPPRIAAVARVAKAVTAAERTLEANGVSRALVFNGERRAPQCASWPTHHYVLQRPYNSPGFTDPILWVNHLDPVRDAALRARYPDRPAYYLTWQKCLPVFTPFELMRFPEKSDKKR